jgi:flavin reductase (DIM6/NTAB) family NADH-FMN oxidoreductase RutF
MKKINIENGIRCMYPMRTYLLTTVNKNGKTNIITVDWVSVISRNPPIICAAISPKRYSHDLILSSKEFIINVPDMSMLDKTFICGSTSGKNFNKFSRLSLKKSNSKTLKTSIIEDCVAFIECKVVDYKDYGDHKLFIGEVKASYANEKFLKDDFKPVLHLKSNLFTTVLKKITKAKLLKDM